MAADTEFDAVCRRIIPLVEPFMNWEQHSAVVDQLNAGEPYEALTWLLPFVLDRHVSLPADLVVRTFTMLEPGDKEEFLPMVKQSLQTT